MYRLTAAVLGLCLIASCTSFSQEDYDRMGALTADLATFGASIAANQDRLDQLLGISLERPLSEDERLAIQALMQRVDEIRDLSKRAREEYQTLAAKGSEGSFDLTSLGMILGTVGTSIAGALAAVRKQRGPSKPMDPADAEALKRLAARERRRDETIGEAPA